MPGCDREVSYRTKRYSETGTAVYEVVCGIIVEDSGIKRCGNSGFESGNRDRRKSWECGSRLFFCLEKGLWLAEIGMIFPDICAF